ncbi:MAG TPA: hypothetical protein VG826_25410 [Pirellulales bacterium]|nr:hypothetical protein [Pirellulales bacterium]
MRTKRSSRAILALAASVAVVACAAVPVWAAGVADLGSLAAEPKFKPHDFEEVRREALDWLAARGADETVRQSAEAIWQAARPPVDLTELVAKTMALADERVASLVNLCAKTRAPGPLAPQEWLKNDELPALERNNARLFYGRWLAQERMYDEALAQLEGLEPGDAVDPASLVFYQAVVYHRLLDKARGLKAIQTLLGNVADVPNRYRSVAALMKTDLEALQDESLDHISRQMEDVRRRLALGRAGKRVREVEDEVIAALDKLIKEQEDRQQQSQSSGGGGAAPQPQQAMPDSRIARMQAPGEVDRRHIGDSSGWGDLPPKQREEALQQIGKDFPPHYRDAIEQYFRKLAAETEER